jgi:intein/homing endonuclease
MITLEFISGKKLTATPNLPGLTSQGWVVVRHLAKGDKVVAVDGFKPASGDVHAEYIKASFKDCFRAFEMSSPNVVRAGSIIDFHGDGSTENIDVVHIQRSLENRIKSSGSESGENFQFPQTNLAQGGRFGDSGKSKSIGGVRSSHGGIGGGNLLEPSFGAESGPLNSLSLALSAEGDTCLKQSGGNTTAGAVEMLAELKNGHLLQGVLFDEISNVDVDLEFDGHVYNLQTKEGYYIADGFIAHNCRCSWVLIPKGESLGTAGTDSTGLQ